MLVQCWNDACPSSYIFCWSFVTQQSYVATLAGNITILVRYGISRAVYWRSDLKDRAFWYFCNRGVLTTLLPETKTWSHGEKIRMTGRYVLPCQKPLWRFPRIPFISTANVTYLFRTQTCHLSTHTSTQTCKTQGEIWTDYIFVISTWGYSLADYRLFIRECRPLGVQGFVRLFCPGILCTMSWGKRYISRFSSFQFYCPCSRPTIIASSWDLAGTIGYWESHSQSNRTGIPCCTLYVI